MWIEVKYKKSQFLLNSESLGVIRQNDCELNFFSLAGATTLHCDDEEEVQAFYYGLKIALNGCDFVSEENYIKPLIRAKQSALYERLLLAEALGDDK